MFRLIRSGRQREIDSQRVRNNWVLIMNTKVNDMKPGGALRLIYIIEKQPYLGESRKLWANDVAGGANASKSVQTKPVRLARFDNLLIRHNELGVHEL